MTDSTYSLNPIGHVAVDESGFSLAIDEPFREALAGLDGFSHINVLFWCHHLDKPEYRTIMTADRPYRVGPEQVGIFATRSPVRPNPIGDDSTPGARDRP